ncbi:phycobilisome rod-core linker polypeptide [Nostoc sp. 'Lobaria pulmonaria (5183) cyanobiont']|uniref:phycobilisome rod-core linker polypeptide n=1 Tax=Nostoc sp. 'Lobaria pulmonaria (5183) cyanobiont' TaxID=1618022 RepID=UPI000CF345FC|nr:phycobilisome rod-core linker polypeptide [Nostoc sp. 'Lobaria pulmonaria (5183) cyanobiont']AVH70717.1 phycobilisome linker polypeptide CpcD [Nostoc sp. 'Lobaria pulmonaria (5183) cyanobiont']
MSLWAIDSPTIELRPNTSESELQTLIQAVYKQVLGNAHLLESERLATAESQLRDRKISVREFVNAVAKSELYQSLFFNSSSQYRFIELNFKHLLGRPPADQAEIAEHVRIYNEQGYDGEIESYIDSNEYQQNFGENIVPYVRSTSSQIGIKNVTFNRTFSLVRGFASSDTDRKAKLIGDIGSNFPTSIKAPAAGSSVSSTDKRFLIKVVKGAGNLRTRLGNMEYVVNYNQLSGQVQNIHRTGGKIISITEVA